MKKLYCFIIIMVAFLTFYSYAAEILPPETIIGKGWAEVKKGNLNEAEKIFRFAELNLSGDYKKQAKDGLAAIKYRRNQNMPQPKNNTPKILKKEALDTNIVFKQAEADGWKKFNSGDYKNAIPLFSKAKRSTDKDLFNNASYGEALSYLKLGNQKQASDILYALFVSGFDKDVIAKQLATIIKNNDTAKKNALKSYFSNQFYSSTKTDQQVLYFQYYSTLANDNTVLSMSDKIKQPMTQEQLKTVNGIKTGILYKNIASSTSDNLSKLAEIDKLLTIYPNDKGMLQTKAWLCLEECKYDCATTTFKQLLNLSPNNEEYVYGLTLTYYDSAKFNEAVDVSSGAKSVRLTSLRDTILNKKASELYQDKDYDGTIKIIDTIEIPSDDNIELKAWSLYHLSRRDEAFRIFADLYKKSPSEKTAGNLVSVTEYNETGLKKALAVLNANDKQTISDKLAEIYGLKEQFYNSCLFATDKSCYYNSDSVLLSGGFSFSDKSGSKGTSQLSASTFNLRAVIPYENGWRAKASQSFAHLDSGSANAYPYVGKYYKYEDTGVKLRDLKTSADVYTTSAEFTKEGDIFYSFGIGSTPYGGTIDPSVTLKLSAWSETAGIKIYRKSVDDSILSATGLKDPYSDATWGRVIDTGISGHYVFRIDSQWWLSLSGSADFYKGNNTADNGSVSIDSAIGKTITTGTIDNTFGMYLSYFNYNNNQNHYTFGNGGYFSPQNATDLGLLYKIENKPCTSTWFSASFSGGYLSYTADAAARYSNTTGDVSTASDFSTDYASEKKKGFDTVAKLAVLHRLTDHFVLGGYFGSNLSSRYNETKFGLTLTYSFEPQKSLVNYKDMLGATLYTAWNN